MWAWYALALAVGALTYHWTKAILWYLNERYDDNRRRNAQR